MRRLGEEVTHFAELLVSLVDEVLCDQFWQVQPERLAESHRTILRRRIRIVVRAAFRLRDDAVDQAKLLQIGCGQLQRFRRQFRLSANRAR